MKFSPIDYQLSELLENLHNSQKMTFYIKDFFSKCVRIRRKLQIWSHLLKKSLMENFIVCKVSFKISILKYLIFCFFTSDNDTVILSEFIIKPRYSIHFVGAKTDFSGKTTNPRESSTLTHRFTLNSHFIKLGEHENNHQLS